MSRDNQPDPDRRDTTLARLIADALETRAAMTSGEACPDAELVAAYAERTLDPDETARWEGHFADCARCQKVIAVLAKNAEDPVPQQGIAGLRAVVRGNEPALEPEASTAETKTTDKAPSIVRSPNRRVLWRWLVPAFGIATAAALWFVLRPTPQGLVPSAPMIAEKEAVPPPPGQRDQMSQTAVAPEFKEGSTAKHLPEGNAAAPVLSPEQEARAIDRENSTAVNRAAGENGLPPDRVRDAARNNSGDKNTLSSEPAKEGERAVPAVSPVPEQRTQSVTVTGALPAMAGKAGADAGGAAPSAALQEQAARQVPAPQASSSSRGQFSANNAIKALPLNGRDTTPAVRKPPAEPFVFSTPDGAVNWRAGAGGLIERSNDGGKTWQRQSSGVTSNLVAGTAVSETTAWIVGSAGVILRTTDGEHWKRTAFPLAVDGSVSAQPDAGRLTTDWNGIAASDALRAAVTSADGRRYVTSDGGRTWTAQP
jgi:hypothetical protein